MSNASRAFVGSCITSTVKYVRICSKSAEVYLPRPTDRSSGRRRVM